MTSRSDIIDGSQAIGRKYGLIYTRKCGWVDLGHANPDGPDGAKNLWDKILNEKDEGSGKSEFFRITRLLKFASMPSALPLIGGLIFSAEGPFSSEIPVLAGFHPPAWGFLPPFGEFWADARLGRRPSPAEQPTQPGQVVGGESEHGLGRHLLQTPEPGLA
ncbi:hypothetical protein sS8_1901 [Methylocaldum marinum]|uniref:Uncharacterized protein n=1 Tax=Methylocaldum marinum TaxID=1432792 RepID=A0A250KQB1_9GAMM|nr:hypothetical protein sS8_1901 [Methylocaldum marinum]